LTYDLYAENDGEPVSTKDQQASESIPPLASERPFHDDFAALLESREFLADGGTLGFGLANGYSIGESFEHVYRALKGSDAVVYRTLRALGFEPVLRMYYHEWKEHRVGESLKGHAAIFNKIVDFSEWEWQDDIYIPDFVRSQGGQFVRLEDLQMNDSDHDIVQEGEVVEVVVWVTLVTTFNRKESAFGSPMAWRPWKRFGVTNVAYGDLCLFVRIGKAGERLSYPRVARSSNYEVTSSEDEEATSSENEEAIRVDSESQWIED